MDQNPAIDRNDFSRLLAQPIVLTLAETKLVAGGRTCKGPYICDDKGYCEDSKGTCTPPPPPPPPVA